MIRYSLGILRHYINLPGILGAVLAGIAAAALFQRLSPGKRPERHRVRAVGLLGTYLVLAFTLLVFARTRKSGTLLNLRLFWSYREIGKGNRTLLYLDILNILLFVPFGILWQTVDRKPAFWKTVACGAGLSLLAELAQLLTARGLFELDDLFHNILGTALGALLWMGEGRLLRSRKSGCRAPETEIVTGGMDGATETADKSIYGGETATACSGKENNTYFSAPLQEEG